MQYLAYQISGIPIIYISSLIEFTKVNSESEEWFEEILMSPDLDYIFSNSRLKMMDDHYLVCTNLEISKELLAYCNNISITKHLSSKIGEVFLKYS